MNYARHGHLLYNGYSIMKKTFLCACIGIFLGMSSMGQGEYTFEAGIVSDNDAYLMLALDQYYTNGLMLYFRYAPGKINEKLNNKIIEFRIGQ
ncbi:MAG: lipid A deacylase LpxR family protein [Bacteroidales bacterium]|nr:lipid A deacylase LpxR family protein [Bacteroidales bacterium]